MNDPKLVSETYGRVAAKYADAFVDELASKPLDRALLECFAADVRARGELAVADLGTGSGQVARFLHDRGLRVLGIDLSPGMIAEARARHPGVEFVVGDLLQFDARDGAFAGLTATMISAAEEAGLAAEVRIERAPYAVEHASTRGYLLARRT